MPDGKDVVGGFAGIIGKFADTVRRQDSHADADIPQRPGRGGGLYGGYGIVLGDAAVATSGLAGELSGGRAFFVFPGSPERLDGAVGSVF